MAGAALGARLQTQTDKCSAPPSARFTLWGLRVGLHQVPTTSFPSGFLLLLLRLGAVPGGGAAAAAAGARGVEVYMTASSTHIPMAAAALTCSVTYSFGLNPRLNEV